MWRNAILFLVSILIVGISASTALPCTSFVINDEGRPVFGKNLDYHIGYGMMIANKRGVAKQAAIDILPAQWVSKYGSVTFNVYGREMPMGGMNEVGLVVENMWLDESRYPADSTDARPTVNSLQWIQYQLDTAGTVKDVIESDKRIRIVDPAGAIHFLVCDRKGDCAAIEFLQGKMVVHTGADLPVRALTNSTYDSSIDFLTRFDGDTKTEEYLAGGTTLGRFVTAAGMLDSFKHKSHDDAIDYGFKMLETVSSPDYTRWSIVYDISEKRVYFRTKTNPERRYVDLGGLEFACGTQVMIHDMDSQVSGDVAGALEPYSYDANRALITKAYGNTEFLKQIPPEVLEQLARYPEALPCSK
jgi:penicillin V acylase-like amidase (Ntn superfamily)